MQAVGADIRRVLKTDAAGVEGFVRNGRGEFARFRGRLANGESIFAALGFGFKTDKLHDDVVAWSLIFRQRYPRPRRRLFLTRLARLRFGGVPSAIRPP